MTSAEYVPEAFDSIPARRIFSPVHITDQSLVRPIRQIASNLQIYVVHSKKRLHLFSSWSSSSSKNLAFGNCTPNDPCDGRVSVGQQHRHGPPTGSNTTAPNAFCFFRAAEFIASCIGQGRTTLVHNALSTFRVVCRLLPGKTKRNGMAGTCHHGGPATAKPVGRYRLRRRI